MAIKECEREIVRLKNALNIQQQSSKQSDEVVRTLKEGIVQQEKWKEQMSSKHTSCNNTAHAAVVSN